MNIFILVYYIFHGVHAPTKFELKGMNVNFRQSEMTAAVGGMQGRSTFHFACALGQVDVRNDIIKAAEPCNDLTDTMEIRSFITVHYDAFSSKKRRG